MAAAARHMQPGSESVGQMQDILRSLEGADKARDALLEQLYAMTKARNSQALASSLGKSGVVILARYGFGDASPVTRRLALRCLHNFLHQAPSTTQIFVDEGFLKTAIVLMKSIEPEDEFLGARLVIVCTNHSAASLLPCLENGDLADCINANIARHASAVETQSFQASLACDANLNLLALLAAKHEAQTHRFLDSLDPILTMLDRTPVQPRPMEPPVSQLVSCLVMIAYHGRSNATGKKPWPPFNVDKLVQILELSIPAYQHEDLDARIIPLVSLLLYVASSAPAEVKERLKAQLLPSKQDRTEVLGKGDSLPHRLVKISTEAVSPELKMSLASLLLELSDGDPQRLVDNVGYGCAVGLLNSRGISMAPGGGEVDQSIGGPSGINPITGQLLDRESQSSGPPMTNEEKEREAEKLFVLFERLKRTGVMNVENPMATAVNSGRVQEVLDDEDDESDS